jgi:drug/metabolite transporter (DMT)-like permease
MLTIGVSDFLGAFATRALKSTFRVVFWLMIGFFLILLVMFLVLRYPIPSNNVIVFAFAAAFFGIIAYLSYYKGLQVGSVSVVAPVANSWAAVTVVLSIIAYGYGFTAVEGIGILMIILGTTLVSFRYSEIKKIKLASEALGMSYALAVLFGWGISFFIVNSLVAKAGFFLPFFFLIGGNVVYLIIFSKVTNQKVKFPSKVAPFIVAIAILEAIGNLSYGGGVEGGIPIVVAPILAASPMITIFLAYIFFGERLERNQLLGVTSILLGLVLVAMI